MFDKANSGKRGIGDIFGSVRWYLYNRYDTYGNANAINWITNHSNKLAILNQFRDYYAMNILTIRSVELYKEMERIVQEGGSIEADGHGKDDRVMAVALALRAWTDRKRPEMLANHLTYQAVTEKEVKKASDKSSNMVGSILNSFRNQQEKTRELQERQQRIEKRKRR
jgi:hypothetical protein